METNLRRISYRIVIRDVADHTEIRYLRGHSSRRRLSYGVPYASAGPCSDIVSSEVWLENTEQDLLCQVTKQDKMLDRLKEREQMASTTSDRVPISSSTQY